ncbi:MAG TPA: DUF1573 domain-containing protein [Ohtaekwangia sp.]|uniref:DUF1573 domain-containing protein n=1 Tax=Ohtaekwangia sp. TaxID=2066019 RepID=UPI002F921632
MKTGIAKSFLFFAVLLATFTACKDRDAEKRIAALESKIADLEAKKTPGTTTPAPTIAAPETKPEGPLPTMEFETMDHDFGTIKEGDIVEFTYKLKNTGAAPLIIQSAQPSCGCTVPDFTKEPIPVGGTGYVRAKFDSNGKQNVQSKSITVTANTFPKQSTLRFKAMITPKAGGSAPAAH